MSDDRFDRLTRSLATARTRRQALKVLGGGLFGGLFLSGATLSRASKALGAGTCLNEGALCSKSDKCCGELDLPGPDIELEPKDQPCCCVAAGKLDLNDGSCTTRGFCEQLGGTCV